MVGVILMYHRVAETTRDPYGLAVRPSSFAQHVDYLAESATVVPLADTVEPGAATTVAITFDDGYADNATTAAPTLVAAGLPATFFITTGTLGGRRFWWDRLADAFLGGELGETGIDVNVSGRAVWLALNDERARLASLRFLHRRLRPLPPSQLEAVVRQALDHFTTLPASPDDQTMTRDQLRKLAELPNVEIGAHTRSHLQLAGQHETLQHDEVVGSVNDLSTMLDRSVRSFAYPFGSRRAVGELAPRLARVAGCTVACSTDSGAVTASTDRHRLPRLNVEDWSVDQLREAMAQLLNHRPKR
jgi:peptidoglycan/xylan/chitin deacetylase (PgdA/CDA1 family)